MNIVETHIHNIIFFSFVEAVTVQSFLACFYSCRIIHTNHDNNKLMNTILLLVVTGSYVVRVHRHIHPLYSMGLGWLKWQFMLWNFSQALHHTCFGTKLSSLTHSILVSVAIEAQSMFTVYSTQEIKSDCV